jgi:phosphohistidine phosphatase SixA
MDPDRPDWRDRIPWIIFGLLAMVSVLAGCHYFLPPAEITTVYIVRHAEKADGSTDPPLSADGWARAQTLAHVLGDARIDAIFVTNFIRTQQTAAPLVAAQGVTPDKYQAGNSQGVADTILEDDVGGRVLVVGHSNTVDDIASALGATGLSDLDEGQFDRLFVIHRFGDVVHLDRLRYGAETP